MKIQLVYLGNMIKLSSWFEWRMLITRQRNFTNSLMLYLAYWPHQISRSTLVPMAFIHASPKGPSLPSIRRSFWGSTSRNPAVRTFNVGFEDWPAEISRWRLQQQLLPLSVARTAVGERVRSLRSCAVPSSWSGWLWHHTRFYYQPLTCPPNLPFHSDLSIKQVLLQPDCCALPISTNYNPFELP